MRVCVIWVVRGYGESVGVRGGIGTSIVKLLVIARSRGSRYSTRKSDIEITIKYIYVCVTLMVLVLQERFYE